MKKIKKSLIATILPALVLGLATPLVGCGSTTTEPIIDTDVEGELTVMMWSGDGSYVEDIGHKVLTAEELFGQNQAAAYAVARAFNQIYPNVKINVFAKQGDPNGEGLTWNQHIENFANEHGHYPSVYAAMDLPGDIKSGMVADLSRFKDDPLYKKFNPGIMQMMNYYGFQAGLPQYLLPWGVFVNKSLAEEKNVDIPDVDWTIEEYTEFVLSGDKETFWGAMDTPLKLIATGTNDYTESMTKWDGTGDIVNVNSEEIIALLDEYIKWTDNSIWTSWDKQEITETEMIDMGAWWSFNYFKNGHILTLDGDPWMMGDLAHPDPNHWGAAKFTDWDIYPRPSTDYNENTVGVVLDPMAVHNFCIDDLDPTCTEEENKKIDLGYAFMSFWVGDTRAWQARADQMFLDGLNLKTSLNDSLPLVTGKDFDAQMDVWYGVDTHTRFADTEKMPGWQKILEIWEAGKIWDVSDKAFPWRSTDPDSGEKVVNVLEFENMWSPDYVNGVARFEEGWKGQVLTLLPEWNEKINARFELSFEELRKGLKDWYGYTDENFN